MCVRRKEGFVRKKSLPACINEYRFKMFENNNNMITPLIDVPKTEIMLLHSSPHSKCFNFNLHQTLSHEHIWLSRAGKQADCGSFFLSRGVDIVNVCELNN